jgi:hypothetical protein
MHHYTAAERVRGAQANRMKGAKKPRLTGVMAA